MRVLNKDRRGICCAGNWIIDHVKVISDWPPEETLVSILAEETSSGGAPYNVSVNLAHFGLDLPVSGLGLVGDDVDGARIIADCLRRGIDPRFLRKIPKAPTAYTDVMTVESTGRRTFFHNRGANALLAPEHFPIEALSCRVMSLGYLLLLDALDSKDGKYGTRAARVLARCRDAGIVTCVDVVSENSDRFFEVVVPSLNYTDYLIVNELEAGKTTGRELCPDGKLDRVELEKTTQELLGHGVHEMVVVHTPDVAFGLTRSGERIYQPALDLSPGFIKGSTGAGDAFFAGMLVAIHEGWDLEKAITFAHAAAGSCLRHPTATGGVGTAEDIWKLNDSYPKKKLL